jgi:hypothetical protein
MIGKITGAESPIKIEVSGTDRSPRPDGARKRDAPYCRAHGAGRRADRRDGMRGVPRNLGYAVAGGARQSTGPRDGSSMGTPRLDAMVCVLRADFRDYERSAIETEANTFASKLLMPTHLIRPVARNHSKSPTHSIDLRRNPRDLGDGPLVSTCLGTQPRSAGGCGDRY